MMNNLHVPVFNTAQINSKRVQILEEGIERLSRLLEAEKFTFQFTRLPSQNKKLRKISNGISQLLSKEEIIAPMIAPAYSDFSDGVWIGIGGNLEESWAVVEFQPRRANRDDIGKEDFSAAMLIIHPVFAGANTPEWLTLETIINHRSVVAETELQFEVLSSFIFPEPRKALHINTVRLTLRCQNVDGSFMDFDVGFIPVTSVPMLHTIINKNLTISTEQLNQTIKMSLIFWLPTHGLYTFNLFSFSVRDK